MPVEVGNSYEFYSTMQQEYEPPEKRIRNYTGQSVLVIADATDEIDFEDQQERMFKVRAENGFEFHAWEGELDGFNKGTGQFFWPDATFGPDHDRTYLVNEKLQR